MTDTKTVSPANRLIVWLGLVQGVVLYALYKTRQQEVWPPESSPLFNALLLATLVLPFVLYWGQGVMSDRRLRRLLALVGLLLLGLSAYQGTTVFPLPDLSKPQLLGFPVFAGLALLTFMLVPLVSAWAGKGQAGLTLGRWEYALLFEHSWRNAVVTVQALVLTGLFWVVLQLGAQLFRLIGVDWPAELVREAWFFIPVTTFSIALGMRAGLRRAAFTHILRNHWLTLTAWLLPIVSLIGAAFALTSLTGVDKLFERGLSAFFLLWFAAFWVKFFNSAFQDGRTEPPFGPWLRRALPYASVGLLVVAGLAVWALLLRIGQHGLTPDRIWGMFVALVALCYGAGYPLSLLKSSGWMRTIAAANVVAALFMCTGILSLLSPVLDARKLSSDSQLGRLHAGKVKAEDFDMQALTQLGSHGYQALSKMASERDARNNPTHLALRAQAAMDSASQYRNWDREAKPREAPVADIQGQLDPYPVGTPLPQGFVEFLKTDMGKWNSWERQRSCFDRKSKTRCNLLQMDLNHDGVNEIVLWKMLNDTAPRVYENKQGQWRWVGHLQVDDYRHRNQNVQADLYVGEFAAEAPDWSELRIGKSRFRVREKADGPSED